MVVYMRATIVVPADCPDHVWRDLVGTFSEGHAGNGHAVCDRSACPCESKPTKVESGSMPDQAMKRPVIRRPCPWCGSVSVRIGGSAGTGYYCVCCECLSKGPPCIRKETAAQRWDKRFRNRAVSAG